MIDNNQLYSKRELSEQLAMSTRRIHALFPFTTRYRTRERAILGQRILSYLQGGDCHPPLNAHKSDLSQSTHAPLVAGSDQSMSRPLPALNNRNAAARGMLPEILCP